MEASGCAMSWPPLLVSEAGCVVSHDRGVTEHGNARNISTLRENASIAFDLLLVHHMTGREPGNQKEAGQRRGVGGGKAWNDTLSARGSLTASS